ncbi:MAG: putative bifunctional diguanylate cyclase/phosphodiesterase [Acidiferrobacterales bacterium]
MTISTRTRLITAYIALLATWMALAPFAATPAARTLLAVIFAGVFSVIAVLGYRLASRHAVQAQLQRLVLFPERNPDPVLALAADGQVIYANAGAGEMLKELGDGEKDIGNLLPADLRQRLATLRALPDPRQVWEYPKGNRVLACSIHFLPDRNEFHAHIADFTWHSRAEARLSHQAHHDILTGLPNRRQFQEHIEQTLAAHDGGHLAVILMDLDRFNIITRSLGHGVGDSLLQAVTARLEHLLADEHTLGADTTLYRFEADVFAIVVSGFTESRVPLQLAEWILAGIQQPLYVNTREYFVTFSIGVSIYPIDGKDGISLLRNADMAMQRAKQFGGNNFQAYSQEMNARAAESLSLENYLRHAMEHNELCLNFQPEIETRSGRILGVEVLLRWNHPERGIIMPSEFISLAEETGMIVPIGEWTLRAACTQGKAWSSAGLAKLTIAVNISARQFHQQDLPGLVRRILEETGLDPPMLELEITEGVAMQDIEHTRTTLKQLKSIGVRLSIDDFGTGFSSLNYLRRFPIDRLKIDQSFVHNLTTDENDAAVTRAIRGLAHSLKLKVIAEGVETIGQLVRLRNEDCDMVQGYYLYKPLSASELAQVLAASSTPWTKRNDPQLAPTGKHPVS